MCYNAREVIRLQIYDGSGDKKFFPTKNTVAVISANRVFHEKKDHMTIRKNGRMDWSLFYCESGRMYFGDQALESGEIWIYPPEVPQKYTVYSKDEVVYRYLHFTGSDIANTLRSLSIPTLVPIKATSDSIPTTLDSISLATLDDSPLSKLKAEYHTLYLISKLARSKKHVLGVEVIKRVTDDMEHSFTQKYDASRYAKLLYLSESRFNHLFKEQTGYSPYAYFMKLRIDNAAALLENTDMKISDVAGCCGFEDPLYFSQVFKRQHSMTPSQYRKLNKYPR